MHSYIRSLLVFPVIAIALFVGACSSSPKPEGKPLPQLTFDNTQPLMVNVSNVNTDNRYNPGNDINDVSASFPTPPDMAFVQYIEQRFRPSLYTGKSALNVVIEGMHVYQNEKKPDGALNKWLGFNDMDHYDVFLAVRLTLVNDYGHEGSQARLEFRGDLNIPEHYSIAKREKTQLRFLETFMKNVDDEFVKTLRDKLHVLSTTSAVGR